MLPFPFCSLHNSSIPVDLRCLGCNTSGFWVFIYVCVTDLLSMKLLWCCSGCFFDAGNCKRFKSVNVERTAGSQECSSFWQVYDCSTSIGICQQTCS